jgi:surfactin synthase thioesterase subunit
MEYVKLICLPYAGGNKYSYRKLEEKCPDLLKIISVEYPGRGDRTREALVTDLRVLADDVYKQVRDIIDGGNYAIYGHSMGGLLACLLTRKIVVNKHPMPLHVFITGTDGPSAKETDDRKRYLLSKVDFIEELKTLHGSPEEILNNEELLNYFEPIIRADFKASETYEYEDFEPLNIPFTVITGTEEDMEPENIRLWQKESALDVDIKRMKGDHFFIFNHSSLIMEIFLKKILSTLNLLVYE